jgi:hypothetical protein
LDHHFNESVMGGLAAGGVAQHSAWDYCGYVWQTEGGWIETVMCHGSVVATYGADRLAVLIDHVIDTHGSD